ncbi:unnamed protein product [Amoebophrya sp. A25]|nr:unnamed protein product [Amoebophrya sp. A25]|eukprot:GSA25T00008634001.1
MLLSGHESLSRGILEVKWSNTATNSADGATAASFLGLASNVTAHAASRGGGTEQMQLTGSSSIRFPRGNLRGSSRGSTFVQTRADGAGGAPYEISGGVDYEFPSIERPFACHNPAASPTAAFDFRKGPAIASGVFSVTKKVDTAAVNGNAEVASYTYAVSSMENELSLDPGKSADGKKCTAADPVKRYLEDAIKSGQKIEVFSNAAQLAPTEIDRVQWSIALFSGFFPPGLGAKSIKEVNVKSEMDEIELKVEGQVPDYLWGTRRETLTPRIGSPGRLLIRGGDGEPQGWSSLRL